VRAYAIRYEPHRSPAVTDGEGRRHPPLSFSYAIRRKNGQLVFRAVNHEEARQLLDRLLEPEGALTR